MISKIDAVLSLVPGAQVVCYGNGEAATIEWINPSVAPVTNEQINAEYARLVADQPLQACKKQASQLLYETDWTTIADVANPANSPYLTNQAEFIAWRSQIRALAVNPVVDPVFPPKPNEVWG